MIVKNLHKFKINVFRSFIVLSFRKIKNKSTNECDERYPLFFPLMQELIIFDAFSE